MATPYKPVEPKSWLDPLCSDYVTIAGDLASVASYAIYGALGLGVLMALAALVRGPAEDNKGGNVRALAPNAGAASAIFAGLKDFVAAISAAPAWIALFGGGVLLFWMSGYAVPSYCQPPAPASDRAQTLNPSGNGQQGITPPRS